MMAGRAGQKRTGHNQSEVEQTPAEEDDKDNHGAGDCEIWLSKAAPLESRRISTQCELFKEKGVEDANHRQGEYEILPPRRMTGELGRLGAVKSWTEQRSPLGALSVHPRRREAEHRDEGQGAVPSLRREFPILARSAR
ncbi:hypothetical protein NMY22_g9886 [Coprinellus aureogranulatus]|nr:hypothetical protein NMY22_g9886 [Coprinellus aureogranulatus]